MSEGSVSAIGPPASAPSAGFERLDTLVRVTTIQSWIYLATLFATGVGALAFAVFYRVPNKVSGEGILLIEKDSISQVRAQATGRLVHLRVQLGDHVERGTVIGEISQEDLDDTIRESEAKLLDAQREDREITAFEQHEKETHGEAMARVKRATDQDQKNSGDKLKIAERLVESAGRLRHKMNVTDLELLDSLEKLYVIRDNLNKGSTRLAELDLEGTKAENARGKSQLDRRIKIKQLERRLAIDRNKMTRMSQVVSRGRGQVAQILSAMDELVHEGAPVVLLHSDKSERGTDDVETSYHSIIFVPAGEGKKIELGNSVEISPATVKREEHGFIRGHVVAVSELPATKLAMESALQHPELVDSFIKRYAPGVLLRVHVKLEEAKTSDVVAAKAAGASGVNHFLWSSSSGIKQNLKTGTMCQAAIVVDRKRLISLVLPWAKHVFGAD